MCVCVSVSDLSSSLYGPTLSKDTQWRIRGGGVTPLPPPPPRRGFFWLSVAYMKIPADLDPKPPLKNSGPEPPPPPLPPRIPRSAPDTICRPQLRTLPNTKILNLNDQTIGVGPIRDIFIGGGGRGGHCPPLNFDNPKRSRIWEAYVVVRLAAM